MKDFWMMIGVIASVLTLARFLEWMWHRPAPPRPTTGLDERLFDWTQRDPFTKRDLLNGGVCIIGRSGSGKTSSSGKELGEAVIRSKRSGGLILAAKPEDLPWWQAEFARAGRADDLLVFSPSSNLRFNFLGYVLQMGGHTRDVTRFISTIGESLRSSDTKGGENADFFEREQDRMIYNAAEVVKQATGTVSAPAIQKFIMTAAIVPSALASPEWQSGYCNQCLRAAFSKEKTPIESHDYHLAADYWLAEFPSMAEKTRSSIMVGVMGILHVFNTGEVRELVSTTTNTSPDDLLAGKWVIVDMSLSEWGDMGCLVAAGWKYLVQRRVLRRNATDDDNIVVIWADEYDQFVTSFDAQYLAQCRSHRGCMVVLTQSLHSFYMSLKGPVGKHQTDALLANFATKIFHALGDVQTAEWASGLIGKGREVFVGTSIAPPDGTDFEFFGGARVSTSSSEHYEFVVKPNLFMNGLRTGGIGKRICDGIVIRSGDPFSNGANWLWREFHQSEMAGKK